MFKKSICLGCKRCILALQKLSQKSLGNMKQRNFCVLSKILNCRMHIITVFKKLNFISNPITVIKCSFLSSNGILSKAHLWPQEFVVTFM